MTVQEITKIFEETVKRGEEKSNKVKYLVRRFNLPKKFTDFADVDFEINETKKLIDRINRRGKVSDTAEKFILEAIKSIDDSVDWLIDLSIKSIKQVVEDEMEFRKLGCEQFYYWFSKGYTEEMFTEALRIVEEHNK